MRQLGTAALIAIAAWAGGLNPADSAVLAADESSSGAVYKGMTFAVNAKGAFLFATNFANGTVDVFGPNGADGMFAKVTLDGHFTEPLTPINWHCGPPHGNGARRATPVAFIATEHNSASLMPHKSPTKIMIIRRYAPSKGDKTPMHAGFFGESPEITI
jgi:hypothetical protein